MKVSYAIALAAVALGSLSACGSSPDCASGSFETKVFSQQVTDPSVKLIKAASIKADGGQYVAGSFRMTDGGKATAVWYIDQNGNGLSSCVGKVTEMVASGGADSSRFGMSAASEGYKDVQGCVE